MVESGNTPGVPGVEAATFTSRTSQGCRAGSLYDDAAFGVPKGSSLPYVLAALSTAPDGFDREVYASTTQSRDLREIESVNHVTLD